MSSVDGPGIRVIVFFQGCFINCAWCHSPHSKPSCSPLLFYEQSCSICMRCQTCKQNVHVFKDGKHILHREFCLQCGKCIDECPNSSVYKESGTLKLPTKKVTAQSLLLQLLPHISLCDGITLSGGEALLQDDTTAFLRLCKDKGIHTCVETSGLLESDCYAKALPFVDVWLFGLRVLTNNNSDFHTKKLIPNAQLIKNASKTIIPVIPLIPGVMDRDEVLAEMLLVLNVIDSDEIQLNPWNIFYDVYYKALGIETTFLKPVDKAIKQCEAKVRKFFKGKGYKLTNRKEDKK